MKETKTVNVTFDLKLGEWVAKDNHQEIARGKGIESEIAFENEWKKSNSKKIKCKMVW